MITPQQAYEASVAKGFYDPIPSQEQRLVLIIGELSEAVEAIRADQWLSQRNADLYATWESDKTEPRRDVYKRLIKETVEEEIADTYIRVLDYMGFIGVEHTSFVHDLTHFPSDYMESILQMMGSVVAIQNSDEEVTAFLLNGLLYMLELFSKHHNIDLQWHVEQKFLYNQSRPFKHGKAF